MTNLLLLIISFLMNTSTLTVKSSGFKHNAMIPAKYTCSRQNISPELDISGIPGNTKTLAVILNDPDAPNGGFVHWVMYNIPVTSTLIKENTAPGKQGKNGKKENKYTGPCPPSGTHHYHFMVYALDTELSIEEAETDKAALEKAMSGHILGSGELVGLYKK